MRRNCEFRALNPSRVGRFYFREESVTATRNRFYKTWTFCGVAEGLADFADRFVESVVEIDESVFGPEFFLKFLASYDLAGVLKQHGQCLEGLFLKANSQAVLPQFARAKIQLEYSKADPRAAMKVFLHEEVDSESECTTPAESVPDQRWGHLPVSLL
jgi:hypothetical protein